MKTNSIDDILACLPEQMSPLEPLDQQLAVHLYRQLATGVPVDLQRLLESTASTADEFSSALDRLSPEIKRAASGEIVAFAGLSLIPTPHMLLYEGRTLYAWCAWDALFIPHLLGGSVQVSSKDPVSDSSIRVAVQLEQRVSAVPRETVVTFPEPTEIDTHLLAADTVGAFCSFVHFFESKETAGSWIEQHGFGKVLILDLKTAFELGIRRNHLRFPVIVQPEIGTI